MTKIRAKISGIQGWAPPYILTNKELESMVDTSDEWIISRTGIKERHILKGEGLGTSDMGAEAVKGLLEKTNTSPDEIDLVICATVTPDMVFPAASNLISYKTGIKNAFSFDMNAACSGLMFAIITGTRYIESGACKKVIVVGADMMSSITDYSNRENCILFGDAAGAMLLEPTTEDVGIMDSIFRTDGSGYPYLHMKAGGSLKPATHETVDAKEHYIFQEGKAVFKFAVTGMADISAEIMEKNIDKTCDILAISRPLINDPEIVKKWMEDPNTLTGCISCNKCQQGQGIVVCRKDE